MAFILSGVVPWGRNFSEYRDMFRLTERDLKETELVKTDYELQKGDNQMLVIGREGI